MPASTTTLADRDALLDALRAANILTPRQFARAESLTSAGSATSAAAALVAAGLLTRFQADQLLAGRGRGLVLGPYIVLEHVGRGAMSRVYRAKHRTMNRLVAIKVLVAERTRTAEDREAVGNELRAAGKLAHPNIVTAYDANELHGRFYLVLEFVDGPNLDALVQEGGPLPVAQACEFVRQAAAGLRHAHEKGMVHRDIKPANLLVACPSPSVPPTVKIADFGIPKTARTAAEFTAPEAAGDPRADLYSLGAVFYFLLVGRPPREGELPLAQLRPDVPLHVAGIVHRLLAKNPAARFASAAELLVHLNSACLPAAVPVEARVCFELPARDGRASDTHPVLASGSFRTPVAEPSPWEQLTDVVTAEGDTVPLELDDDPPAPRRAKPPGREPVPVWMTAMLLVGAVSLCMLGVGAAVKLLAK